MSKWFNHVPGNARPCPKKWIAAVKDGYGYVYRGVEISDSAEFWEAPRTKGDFSRNIAFQIKHKYLEAYLKLSKQSPNKPNKKEDLEMNEQTTIVMEQVETLNSEQQKAEALRKTIQKLEKKLFKKKASLESVQENIKELADNICEGFNCCFWNETVEMSVKTVFEDTPQISDKIDPFKVPTTVEELKIGDEIKITDQDLAKQWFYLPVLGKTLTVLDTGDIEHDLRMRAEDARTGIVWGIANNGWEFVRRPSEEGV